MRQLKLFNSFVGQMALEICMWKGEMVEEGSCCNVWLRMGRLVVIACEIALWGGPGGTLEGNYGWVGCFSKEYILGGG